MASWFVNFRSFHCGIVLLFLLPLLFVLQRLAVITQEVDQPHSSDFSDAAVVEFSVASDELPETLSAEGTADFR